MSAHATAVLAALLVVLAGPAGGPPFDSHAAEPYGLTVDGTVSVHTPAEAVTLGGTTVDVDSTSPHSGYEPITVTVTAPTGDARLELFDANGDRRTVVDRTGDTATIPTEALSSGTYYLVVRDAGELRAVERLVVSRHDVDVAVDEAGGPDEFAFYVTVIPGGDIPYHGVEVVATDGTREVTTDGTELRQGLYAATVDRTALPAGEYAVYARLVGRPGPYVGMSEALTVRVDGDTAAEGDRNEQAGQAGTTDVASDVATEGPTSPSPETTSTQFPETGVVLLLLTLVVGGLVVRLRPRR
ncbi:T9SS type A sorting domain-containing protein [Salinigranum sp.]|uniref:T9SS type A sorting domain-containing protein n=1 Tax=Salinigranum sp. TaxID=1966351 RepID=UPI0035630810